MTNTERKQFDLELLGRTKEAVMKLVDKTNPEREWVLTEIKKFCNMLNNGFTEIPEERLQVFRGKLMSFGPDVIGTILGQYQEEQDKDELFAATQNVVEQLRSHFPWIECPEKNSDTYLTDDENGNRRCMAYKIAIGNNLKTSFGLSKKQATQIYEKLKNNISSIVSIPEGYGTYIHQTPHWMDDEVFIYIYKKVA